MIMGLYSVYDRLAEEYGPVFEAPTNAVACRSFEILMKEAKIGKVSEYKLLSLGSVDHTTGEISGKFAEDITPVIDLEVIHG